MEKITVEYDLELNNLKVKVDELKRAIGSVENASKKAGSGGTDAFDKTAASAKKATDATKGVEKGLGGVAGSLKSLASLAATGVFLEIGRQALAGAANMEQLRISFTTMLGSAEKANVLLQQITNFAATTPFELTEVAEASKKLIAFGIDAKNIIPTLKAVGDVSAGIGAPIGEIAELYGKAKVQGRLFAEDINQLTGRGIPIIQELAKQFNVTDAEVKALVENGQVNFGNLEQAFQDLTSEGGKFADLMAKQADSVKGQWSNLKDVVSQALTGIGVALEPFTKKALEFSTKLVQGFMDLGSYLKNDLGKSMKQIAQEQASRAVVDAASFNSLAQYEQAIAKFEEKLRMARKEKDKDIIASFEQAVKGIRYYSAKFQEEQKKSADNTPPPPLSEKQKKEKEKQAKETVKLERQALIAAAQAISDDNSSKAAVLKLRARFEIEDYKGKDKSAFAKSIGDKLADDLKGLEMKKIPVGIDALDAEQAKRIDLLNKGAKEEGEIVAGIVEGNKILRKQETDDIIEQEKLRRQVKQETIAKAVELGNTLFEISSVINNAELEKINITSTKELESLEEQKEKKLISEKEYNAQREQIEKHTAKEIAEVRRKQAIQDRVQAAFNIGINTAQAVAAVLSTGGGTRYADFGVSAGLLTALVLAQGAAQLAAVFAKPLPEVPAFKVGVVDFKGKGTGTSDSNLARISHGESVITAAGTDIAKEELEILNKNPFAYKKLMREKYGYELLKEAERKSRTSKKEKPFVFDDSGLRHDMKKLREAETTLSKRTIKELTQAIPTYKPRHF